MAPTHTPDKRALIAEAHRVGIQEPERFSAEELEALLAALPGTSVSVTELDAPTSTGTQEAKVVTPDHARPSREPEPYQENPFFVEPVPAMRGRMGLDAVWLYAVDPETLFATWDLSDETLDRLRAGPTTLRLFSPDAAGHVDEEIDARADSWYIRSHWERVRIQAMLGTGRGDAFRPLVTSRAVAVPPRTAAPLRPAYKVHVPYDLDRRAVPRGAIDTWSAGKSVVVEQPSTGPSHLPATAIPTAPEGPAPIFLHAMAVQPAPVDVPIWTLMDPPLEAPPEEAIPEEEQARLVGVVRGSWRWSWRGNGPGSSDVMMFAEGAWEQAQMQRHRRPFRPAPEQPSSFTMPSSFSSPSSRGRP